MITELTGMELANASLLDESTAAAEAMLMFFHMRSRDQQKRNVNKFFLSERVFEQNKEVILARAEPLGIEVLIENPESIQFSDEFFGAIVQYPDAYGEIHDYSGFVEKAKQFQIPVAAIADIMSLVLLKALLVGELMWWWVLLNVLVFLWDTEVLMQLILPAVKSTNDLFQEE